MNYTDAERKAIKVLQVCEWPDSPTHGMWRAECMIKWLKDAGIELTEATP